MLQHVHGDDVARLHGTVMDQPEASVSEAFNAVCEQSLTLRRYAALVAARGTSCGPGTCRGTSTPL